MAEEDIDVKAPAGKIMAWLENNQKVHSILLEHGIQDEIMLEAVGKDITGNVRPLTCWESLRSFGREILVMMSRVEQDVDGIEECDRCSRRQPVYYGYSGRGVHVISLCKRCGGRKVFSLEGRGR